MDLPIYLTLGLLAGGYMLNDEKQPRPAPKLDPKVRLDQHENKKSGNHNIYDSSYFNKVREIEDEKVIKNFEKSYDPINTNVIPFYFNSLNETNVKRIKNINYDTTLFQKELARVMEKTPIAITRLEPTPNDLTVLNQDGSVESGGFQGDPPRGLYAETDLNKNWGEVLNRPETVRDGNNREGFETPMTHNNMVPFFSGASKQNMDMDNRLLDNKLETFTGQFKLDRKKIESTPLFAPVQQNLEQLAAPRELDRYTTAVQIRNNELPFEQTHVGPGVNDGYTARPSGGFHNPIRVLPKNIDQLLVNPRVVTEGRVVRGKAIDKRTASQKQFKYRPELLVTNFNGERNMTTVGAVTKPTVRSLQNITDTNRQKSRQVMGNANRQTGSKSTASKLLPMGKMSTKASFKNTPYRNAVQTSAKKAHNDAQLTYENRSNERSVTEVRFGQNGNNLVNRKGLVNAVQTPVQDRAKTTRKQAYIINTNPNGYIANGISKGKVYNPNDQTKTTHRQTTENNTHKGQVSKSVNKGKTYNPNDRTRTTIREQTEVQTHQGHLAKGANKGLVSNPNDQTKTTHREQTGVQSYMGMLTNAVKGLVSNPNDQTRTTIREQTGIQTHQGQLHSNVKKGLVSNPNDPTRTTIREQTGIQTHQGQLHSEVKKGLVSNPNDQTRTTIREQTGIQTHQGQLHSNVKKGLVSNPNDQTRTTIRENTGLQTHQGQLNVGVKKGLVSNPNDQTRTTIREGTSLQTHQGQLNSGVKKGLVSNPNDQTRTTIRESTGIQTHTGQIQVGQTKHQNYAEDEAKSTIRQSTENQTHQGHVQNGIKKTQTYILDEAKSTIRQSTENQSHTGHVQNGIKKTKMYADDDAKSTIRQSTENQSHIGQVQSGLKKNQIYIVDEAKSTIREGTESNKSVGIIGKSDRIKGQVYNPNDVAKTTIREGTETDNHMGVVSNPSKTKQIAYNPNSVAKTTIREQTELTDKVGIVSNSVRTKQIVYDPFDFAKTTIKEQTENVDYIAPMSAKYLESGGYQTAPTDVKNINRQYLADFYYTGGAGQADAPSNPQSQESAFNMRQNTEKEIVAEGRAPTLSGVKLTLGKTGVNIEIKKLDQDRVNQYSAVKGPTFPNSRKPMNPCEMTTMKNNLPPFNSYLDPTVLGALKSNPLAQSLHSWA